ncbi:MAG TPA: hypothetical protein VGR01_00495 [Burkholderiales bacterium]|jgi:hypothetical protein|nr:hypothetical protein [Burkholderiales bacterium]
MPCADRHFLPGQVWHITHRCHQKAFLLKFARDRQHYLRWLSRRKNTQEYLLQTALGGRASHRQIAEDDGIHTLREPAVSYAPRFDG